MLIALLLAAAAPETQSDSAAKNAMSAAFANLFVDACVLGELRLPASAMQEVTWEEVRGFPYTVPERNAHSRYYRIKRPVEATLTITDYDAPDKKGRKSNCGIQTTRADLFTLLKVVVGRLDIPDVPKQINSTDEYEVTVPERHYRISLRQGDAITTVYDDATSKTMLAEQRKLKLPRIRAFNWNYQ